VGEGVVGAGAGVETDGVGAGVGVAVGVHPATSARAIRQAAAPLARLP
jgi:hypothetical protein